MPAENAAPEAAADDVAPEAEIEEMAAVDEAPEAPAEVEAEQPAAEEASADEPGAAARTNSRRTCRRGRPSDPSSDLRLKNCAKCRMKKRPQLLRQPSRRRHQGLPRPRHRQRRKCGLRQLPRRLPCQCRSKIQPPLLAAASCWSAHGWAWDTVAEDRCKAWWPYGYTDAKWLSAGRPTTVQCCWRRSAAYLAGAVAAGRGSL